MVIGMTVLAEVQLDPEGWVAWILVRMVAGYLAAGQVMGDGSYWLIVEIVLGSVIGGVLFGTTLGSGSYTRVRAGSVGVLIRAGHSDSVPDSITPETPTGHGHVRPARFVSARAGTVPAGQLFSASGRDTAAERDS